MSLPARALPFGNKMPTAEDKECASALRGLIEGEKSTAVELCVPDPRMKKLVEIPLTPSMSELLLDLLRCIANGDAVAIVPIQQLLTTQQAAALLNVSRPYFIKLLEDQKIPHSFVGRHRRVRAEDVFAYKAAIDQARSDALDELVAMDADQY